MDTEAIETLREIGRQLDRNVFPRVRNGGIVMPSEPAVPSLTLGAEKDDVRSTERRSETRSRTGSPGGQGSTRRPWSSSGTTPVVCTDLQAKYDEELRAVHEIYPATQLWHQEQDLWLLTKSGLLPGLRQNAIFLTGVSYAWQTVRSWGFWEDLLTGATWIGPRHTNFPDGSVCAFEPTDRTWVIGDSILKLLDLYSLWAVRHLHLQVFGRWPGRQAVHHPYERILELREDEYCGCAVSDKLYGECCRDKDLARHQIADAVNFFFLSGGRLRQPPKRVVRFVRQKKDPPCIGDLLAQ